MKTVTYTKLDGEKFTLEYDPDAPCICCGQPVIEASMGGTIVCPWCDCGHDRNGNQIILKHGPKNPHPKYLEHYVALEDDTLRK